jgi:hypothetical protein
MKIRFSSSVRRCLHRPSSHIKLVPRIEIETPAYVSPTATAG